MNKTYNKGTLKIESEKEKQMKIHEKLELLEKEAYKKDEDLKMQYLINENRVREMKNKRMQQINDYKLKNEEKREKVKFQKELLNKRHEESIRNMIKNENDNIPSIKYNLVEFSAPMVYNI